MNSIYEEKQSEKGDKLLRRKVPNGEWYEVTAQDIIDRVELLSEDEQMKVFQRYLSVPCG